MWYAVSGSLLLKLMLYVCNLNIHVITSMSVISNDTIMSVKGWWVSSVDTGMSSAIPSIGMHELSDL